MSGDEADRYERLHKSKREFNKKLDECSALVEKKASEASYNIKKISDGTAAKASDLKNEVKNKFFRQPRIEPHTSNQTEIIDVDGHAKTDNNNNKELIKSVVVIFLLCLVVYGLGYFAFSILYLIIPIVAYVIYKQQKKAKAAKSALAKEIAEKGEEEVLKSRLLKEDLPSWFQFPDIERVEWINHILTSFWPHIEAFAVQMLRCKVEPLAREILEKNKLWGFKFNKIEFGKVPPRLTGVKVFDTPSTDEVVMDVDFEYTGDADISISLLKVSASVSDVRVAGKLRVILKPLIGEAPIVGGVQLFFLKAPDIDFDLGGIASFLDLPGLNSLIMNVIEENIRAQLVIPNKVSIVLTDKVSPMDLKMPRPVGVLLVKVMEAKDLISADMATSSDPYVVLQHGVRERKTSVGSGTHPSWNENLEFPVDIPESQELQLMVFDKDQYDDDDFMGQARIDVQAAVTAGAVNSWFVLSGVESGSVRLQLTWLPVSTDRKDYEASSGVGHSRAALLVYLDRCSIRPIYSDVPELMVEMVVGEKKHESKVIRSREPVFEEGYTFLIKKVEGTELVFYVKDTEEEDTVAKFSFAVKEIFNKSDLTVDLASYNLPKEKGSIRFAAKLVFLEKCKSPIKEGGGSKLQKASVLASTSSRMVRSLGAGFGAAGSAGFKVGAGLGSAGHKVGSATWNGAKSVGSVTKGAVTYLGTSSTSAIQKLSPKVERKKKEEEKEEAKPQNFEKVQSLEVVADDDESKRTMSRSLTLPSHSQIPRLVVEPSRSESRLASAALPAPEVPSETHSSSESKSESNSDKLRRRLSDGLKSFSFRK